MQIHSATDEAGYSMEMQKFYLQTIFINYIKLEKRHVDIKILHTIGKNYVQTRIQTSVFFTGISYSRNLLKFLWEEVCNF